MKFTYKIISSQTIISCKQIVCFGIISCFLFNSCNKVQSEQRKTNVKQESVESIIDPEIEKLGRVLSSLSEKAKLSIPNGNPQELLADLKLVLDDEKTITNDISLLTLIDRTHPIASNYVPNKLIPLIKNNNFTISRNDLSLRSEAYDALLELSNAAKVDGITLQVSSTYRSYDYQKKVYAKWVEIDGPEEADRESARPGTSQHQLGTAIDFGSIDDDFWETKMGKWLYSNSSTYGWSLSFPEGYEDITGYRWECWHYRYIGKKACEFQDKWFGGIQQFMLEFINTWKNQ